MIPNGRVNPPGVNGTAASVPTFASRFSVGSGKIEMPDATSTARLIASMLSNSSNHLEGDAVLLQEPDPPACLSYGIAVKPDKVRAPDSC